MQLIFNKYGKSFYNVSFNEGNTSNTLEVIAKKRVEMIETSENLANSLSDNEIGQFTYRLHFQNKNSLEKFKSKLDNDQNIQKVNVVYN